ncbi:MAG: hypothetical protein QF719_11700, partial [Chloroflexota bacterium]|nr:hypothetical protein [Chloroflexota bacterium]
MATWRAVEQVGERPGERYEDRDRNDLEQRVSGGHAAGIDVGPGGGEQRRAGRADIGAVDHRQRGVHVQQIVGRQQDYRCVADSGDELLEEIVIDPGRRADNQQTDAQEDQPETKRRRLWPRKILRLQHAHVSGTDERSAGAGRKRPRRLC